MKNKQTALFKAMVKAVPLPIKVALTEIHDNYSPAHASLLLGYVVAFRSTKITIKKGKARRKKGK